MENNPVMQRVTMLTEMWKEAVMSNKQTRVFSWMGTSSIDYRMIRGFVMFHTSDKSNLGDVFFSLNQPYEKNEIEYYGERLIKDMSGFLQAWNEDTDLTAKTGEIVWKPLTKNDNQTDPAFFIENINLFAESLGVTGKTDVLAVALLPQSVADYGSFVSWVGKCIDAGISEKVRLMVFDTYEMKAFKEIETKHADYFTCLYPNMDMPGAMNQILENAKAQKKSHEDKDAVSYQQSLIKMSESIGYDHQKNVEIYRNECLQLAMRNNWPHLEALVYFFLHGYFASKSMAHEALDVINKAIEKSDFAIEKKIIETTSLKYQYRIAKANYFFSEKRFTDAIDVYKECLQLDRTGINTYVILGIYHMLGNSVKNAYSSLSAWSYFEEGWLLLEKEDKSEIMKNPVVMFYAKDMMETAPGNNDSADGYYFLMKEWWGTDWMQKLNRNEYNPVLN